MAEAISPEELDTRLRCMLESEAQICAKSSRAKRPRFVTLRERVSAQDSSGTAEGSRRLKLFWDNIGLIEDTYLTLSKQQRHIIEEFVRSCIIKIVGQENFERNPAFFMQQTGKTTQECLSIVITPRRFGKTTACSMFVAAVLLSVPNIVVSIFSTGRRASSMLLAKILQIVNGVPGSKVIAHNQETLKIKGASVHDIRTCHSYPSNLNTLKGVGCDIGIMEEFTRCDPAVWQEVVVPLLGVSGTAIVAISTPLGEDNWYTGLITRKTEDGEKLFNVVQYSLVCDECKAKGIATECQHKTDLLPPWKSESRQRLVKFLLSDSSDLYLTEAMGMISSSSSRCFSEDLVNQWVLRPIPPQVQLGSSATVFVGIDPTSGIRSELAICSMYFDATRRLVCMWVRDEHTAPGHDKHVSCVSLGFRFQSVFAGQTKAQEKTEPLHIRRHGICFASHDWSVRPPCSAICALCDKVRKHAFDLLLGGFTDPLYEPVPHDHLFRLTPYCMHGEMKICGLDSESIGDAEVDLQNELVVKHMRGLQRKFWGKRVRYISLVEGNMSWVVANQICQVMDAFQPIMHGCKDESKKVVGVSTTEQVKENMVNTARSLMHQRKLCVHRDVVCEGRRRGLEHDAKCASVIGVLGEQLKRLQMRTKPGKDIFSKTKSKISGKKAKRTLQELVDSTSNAGILDTIDNSIAMLEKHIEDEEKNHEIMTQKIEEHKEHLEKEKTLLQNAEDKKEELKEQLKVSAFANFTVI